MSNKPKPTIPAVAETAFLAAFDAYSDAIFRYCLYRVYNRERAKDLTQETFARTWRYLVEGHMIENLRAFLYRTATNLIIDESRKRHDQSLEAMQEKGFDLPARELDPAIRADAHQARELIETLDEEYRQAVVLRCVEGLPPREIATITGESPNTISVRVHRGLRQLRAKLKEAN